jgi:hypothetical protein
VIDPGKHAQHTRHAHYDMEMRDHKISIMKLDVQGAVPKKDRQASPG